MQGSKKRNIKRIRYLRRKVERLLKKKRKVKPKKKPKILVKDNKIKSKLIDFLTSKNFAKKRQFYRSKKKDTVTIEIPSHFSFYYDPEEAIGVLREIFYYGMHKSVNKLFFNHTKCGCLGICASTIMDVILLEIRDNNAKLQKEFTFGGALPEKQEVKDILEASGILQHLNFHIPEKSYIRKLDLIRSVDQAWSSGLVATKIIDYFIKCLATQGFALTKAGTQKFGQMIGEVIDNCNIHAGDLKHWYTLGHYHLYNQKDYGECHLVIFNFGHTIYESLKSPSTSVQMLKSLNDLTKKHRKLFDKYIWTEENLWTLYALQEGVSRFRDQENPDRGNGTIKLIESFQSVGRTRNDKEPIMSITSGKTHILFNNKYKLQHKDIGEEQRQIIAFNKDNDLNELPDGNNVRTLANYFPGTVISMKFYIDHSYIAEKIRENNKVK